jgi:transposase
MDMSRSFQAGARQQFRNAQICFDAFHVSKLVHDALDEVRRSEVKQEASLKGDRWALLKSPKDWSLQQITDMHWLQRSGLKAARAWRMKERYKEIHAQCRAGAEPEPLFRAFISWTRRSRLDPFKRLGKTPKAHLPGILAAYRLGASNAVADNINSQIQAAIVRARGFKSLMKPHQHHLSDDQQAAKPSGQSLHSSRYPMTLSTHNGRAPKRIYVYQTIGQGLGEQISFTEFFWRFRRRFLLSVF